jgi:predicted phosphodiesterase
MKQCDLGTIDAPLVLFGGVYSNLQALEALFAQAAGRQMICTGDVVAYCGQPFEAVEAIRATKCHVVAGNCEQQLAAGAEDCGCGFEEGTACDLLSAGWFGYASAQVTADQRAWMSGLCNVITFTHHGARYGVLHGGATDIARFIWSVSAEEVFSEEWTAAEAIAGPLDHIICGHSGIAFQRGTAKGRWINAGVIGMPPHDGAQQTQYAILEEGEITFHRLSYDVSAAIVAMENAGLTQGYHQALDSGYWPSEDVLPSSLRISSASAKG